jgi:cardiolipin synthase (CMP-forming)
MNGLILNIPNLISFARLLCVPLTVWLILNGRFLAAFWIFVIASLSDAADGFIARRFNLRTVLGGYIDPLADKALLVSVFVTLGHEGFIPSWLVIMVVFRDVMIVSGAILYQILFGNLTMEPLVSSKINTAVQFLMVSLILGLSGYGINDDMVVAILTVLTVLTTIWSGGAYVVVWGRKASAQEPGE